MPLADGRSAAVTITAPADTAPDLPTFTLDLRCASGIPTRVRIPYETALRLHRELGLALAESGTPHGWALYDRWLADLPADAE